MKKPNILFIMCDQMRFDAIAYNGNKVIKTPNLDRLASQSVNFNNAFTPCPICVPARAAITTGCYPHKCTGNKDNLGEIKETFPLLGEELNKRGYETYAMGKLHYLPYKDKKEERTTYGIKHVELVESGRMLKEFDPTGQREGIEDYFDYLKTVGWGGYTRGSGMGNNDIFPVTSAIPEEHYVDTWVTDRSLYHMEKHLETKSEVPFFMWASFPKPHSAYDPPYPYNMMYDPREMPSPIGDIEAIRERGLYKLLLDYHKHDWEPLSPEAKKVIKAYYYGLISLQDKQIGRLLDFLEKKEILEDTIIIYTTDHGEMLGDFGLYFKKKFYNGSVKIPMMISYPKKFGKGMLYSEPVGLQDLLPTVMSLIGEPLEQKVDGQDLTTALTNNTPIREYYISQCDNHPWQQYMVAGKEWKYIYNEYGGIEELYNLKEDSNELHNLAGRNDEKTTSVKNRMRQYLINWCKENGDMDMLDGNDLRKESLPEKLELPDKFTGFGRRYY